jgi:diacylglycerol kinase (ATP)
MRRKRPMHFGDMDAKTAFLVLNPVSGVSQPEYVRGRFEAFFQDAGWNTIVYQTTGKENIAEIVRQAVKDGAEMIVAAGGDGTLSAAGSGLVDCEVPLGILPTGTWNALAHNLGIPIALDDALRLLVNPHRLLQMDGLQVGERTYLLNVGVGLSAAVIQTTLRHQKRRFGFLAYVWNLIIQATGLRIQQYRMEIDGKEHKIRATELMIVSASIIGMGELPTVLEIHPDDGKVEVIILRSPTVFGLIKIAFFFLIGRRKKTQGLLSFSASRHITLRTRKSTVVQADGEIIGHTPLEVTIRPGAVRVIVPDKMI